MTDKEKVKECMGEFESMKEDYSELECMKILHKLIDKYGEEIVCEAVGGLDEVE